MIDFESLSRLLRRARSVFLAAAILLAAAAGASFVLDVPALAHSRADRSGDAVAHVELPAGSGIKAEDVTNATRGKAVFRTLRLTAPKPVDETGRFRLTGTSSRGGEASAYVRDTKINETFKLKVGSSLAGQFEVVAIHKDSIELKRGGEIVALSKK